MKYRPRYPSWDLRVLYSLVCSNRYSSVVGNCLWDWEKGNYVKWEGWTYKCLEKTCMVTEWFSDIYIRGTKNVKDMVHNDLLETWMKMAKEFCRLKVDVLFQEMAWFNWSPKIIGWLSNEAKVCFWVSNQKYDIMHKHVCRRSQIEVRQWHKFVASWHLCTSVHGEWYIYFTIDKRNQKTD